MQQYPLWAFSDGNIIVVTRGETQDQIFEHAANSQVFKRGATIYALDYVPIESGRLYSGNHDDGWLHRIPVWLKKRNRTK